MSDAMFPEPEFGDVKIRWWLDKPTGLHAWYVYVPGGPFIGRDYAPSADAARATAMFVAKAWLADRDWRKGRTETCA